MPTADEIIERGKIALTHNWDSGGPGAEAGAEQIYRLGEHCAVSSEAEGPLDLFQSLLEAIEQTDILIITDASKSIDCGELSIGQILDLLLVQYQSDGPSLDINGHRCVYDMTAVLATIAKPQIDHIQGKPSPLCGTKRVIKLRADPTMVSHRMRSRCKLHHRAQCRPFEVTPYHRRKFSSCWAWSSK